MKKVITKITVFALLLCIILGLSSCTMIKSYTKFYIKNITENLDDCFTSESFDFARIGDIVIIPEIKAINHEEYVIWIAARSQNANEELYIKSIILKENDIILLSDQVDEKIIFECDGDALYKGSISTTFAQDTVVNENGYELVVTVETIINGSPVEKTIVYDIFVKSYQSFVFPT